MYNLMTKYSDYKSSMNFKDEWQGFTKNKEKFLKTIESLFDINAQMIEDSEIAKGEFGKYGKRLKSDGYELVRHHEDEVFDVAAEPMVDISAPQRRRQIIDTIEDYVDSFIDKRQNRRDNAKKRKADNSENNSCPKGSILSDHAEADDDESIVDTSSISSMSENNDISSDDAVSSHSYISVHASPRA